MLFKIIIVIVFFASMLIVGFKANKSTSSSSGFALGNRGIGPWIAAFAFGTAYFSAVVFVGTAGQYGWRVGIADVWIAISAALLGCIVNWSVLAKRSMKISHNLGCTTLPEFFEMRYGRKSIRIVLSAIIFIFLIPYTASLYNGLSRLFAMAFHIDYTICIMIMSLLTAVYVIAGGYLGAVMNNFIQGLIMLVGIVIIVGATLSVKGGLTKALVTMSQASNADGIQGAYVSFLGAEPGALLSMVILVGFGVWGLPQMIQNYFALKDEKAIRPGMIVACFFALILAGGCYFLGALGRIFVDDQFVAENGYDAIVPEMLSHLPDVVIGIAIVLVLAASMSTLASLVINSSSTLTLDFLISFRREPMEDRQKVLTMRIFIVVFIAVSAGVAIIQYKYGLAFIAQLFGMSWGAIAGAIIGPYLYSIYWKKTHSAGVWACFIFGPGLMAVNMLFKQYLPPFFQNSNYCADVAMIAGLFIVPIVSIIANRMTKDPGKVDVEKIFAGIK